MRGYNLTSRVLQIDATHCTERKIEEDHLVAYEPSYWRGPACEWTVHVVSQPVPAPD